VNAIRVSPIIYIYFQTDCRSEWPWRGVKQFQTGFAGYEGNSMGG
jgi:hypothetical protein